MKYLFIVQGEGRGHFMQALAMSQILSKQGHDIAEVLVGKSPMRTIPDFFLNKIGCQVTAFDSPNFLPSQNKKVKIFKSVLYNIRNTKEFIHSIQLIRNKVLKHKPDVVVNFYDLIAGLTFGMFKPTFNTKFVCIAHQYLLLHPEFEIPNRLNPEVTSLLTYTRMTALNADKMLGLSFSKIKSYKPMKIISVPPILRTEILEATPENGDFLLGYLLNPVYEDEILEWHNNNPEVKLDFFWDKNSAANEEKIDDTLTMHKINDVKFIEKMRTCKAYASTGGFESICEALYLEKPVVMVPAHIEQSINVHDAQKAGAGIGSSSFDLTSLINYIPSYKPNKEFKVWVHMAHDIFVRELTIF